MATINSTAFIGFTFAASESVDLSASLSAPLSVNAGRLTHKLDFNNLPIVENVPVPKSSKLVIGRKQPTFSDDYYNRVHIQPSNIDLGNLASDKTIDVTVWSAFDSPKSFEGFSSLNANGLALIEPVGNNAIFPAFEARVFELHASFTGPPTINATFYFKLDGDNYGLHVTGSRSFIIATKPKYPLKESLEWKTDIIKSFSKEQRISLRDAPRQSLDMEFVLTNQEFSKLKGAAYKYVGGVFSIPVWADAIELQNVASGSTYFEIDCSTGDFRVDDQVILWSSNDVFEVLESISITDGLTTRTPCAGPYDRVLIMPLRSSNALTGLKFERDADGLCRASTTLSIRKNANREALAYPIYLGKPVLVKRPQSSETLSDQYYRDFDVFDNDSSAVTFEYASSGTDVLSTFGFRMFSKSDLLSFVKFLHYLHGRRRTFFVPSWHDDFEVVTDVVENSASINVKNTSFTTNYDNQFLFIELLNGSMLFKRITGSVIDGDTEQLQVTPAFDAAVNIAEIRVCSLLKHVRLNTDAIQLKYEVGEQSSVSIQVKEVSYEL